MGEKPLCWVLHLSKTPQRFLQRTAFFMDNSLLLYVSSANILVGKHVLLFLYLFFEIFSLLKKGNAGEGASENHFRSF